MAKSKALIAAEARIAAPEAQLQVARTCYRELKHSIQPITVAAPRVAEPHVSRYTDGIGRVWIKTRIGNKAVSRLAA